VSITPEESAAELLLGASQLLKTADDRTAGLWPRASALLARQALELKLSQLWRALAPGLEDASFRTQLLCLHEFLGDNELAEHISVAWWALSRACHYHPYELSPTVAELSGWFGTIHELCGHIDGILTRRATRSGEVA
jgi:hypothetical protein